MNTFSDPIKIINQVALNADPHIADFGCGAGAYSLELAKKNPTGKIFAIDVRKEMIERLSNIAESSNLKNIHVVWGDVDENHGSRLRESTMDAVFLINTLFQAEKKKDMLAEVSRILKIGGKLILVDWSESFGNIGPAIADVILEDTAKLLVEEAGLMFENELDAGEHHYGFIARKV